MGRKNVLRGQMRGCGRTLTDLGGAEQIWSLCGGVEETTEKEMAR